MREPLIPQGCLEPYEALQFFTHAFEARYGPMHPLFLIGSLSEAVGEATSGSALSGTVSTVCRIRPYLYPHSLPSTLSLYRLEIVTNLVMITHLKSVSVHLKVHT